VRGKMRSQDIDPVIKGLPRHRVEIVWLEQEYRRVSRGT
jgi:hypothetical protein